MSTWKRLGWLGVMSGLPFGYVLINRLVSGGVMLKLPLDDYLPLWPLWVIPYGLACVWWFVSFAWAAWKMEAQLLQAFALALVLVLVSAFTIFIFYPTYIQRPIITGTTWPEQWLNWIYAHDRVYNAFPCGHVYLTTLIALFWGRWFPRWRWVWAGTVVVVILSTLFTHQHYLLDPLGGLVLAWVGYRAGLWWVFERGNALASSSALVNLNQKIGNMHVTLNIWRDIP